MAYDYDALYRKNKDALGAPTKEFVRFFEDLKNATATVLDIGCGQGRDAIFIARRGHAVTAMDLSPAGIADIQAVAKTENLPLTAVVADVTTYTPDGQFDVILIDRTLHMLEKAPRLAALSRLLGHVAPLGWVLIADEASNMPGFRDLFIDDVHDWHTIKDTKGFLFMRRA